MEKLKTKQFRAIDWGRPSIVVAGMLTVRDYHTLEPASPTTNKNGYVICIENEDGVHIVSPDSIELVE